MAILLELTVLRRLQTISGCRPGLAWLTEMLMRVRNVYNEAGLSLLGLFVGGAAHADDIRTIATSTSQISSQVSIINDFTSRNRMKDNSSKTEIVRISRQPFLPEQIELSPTNIITTLPEVKCLGTWWSHNLSALKSVQENI